MRCCDDRCGTFRKKKLIPLLIIVPRLEFVHEAADLGAFDVLIHFVDKISVHLDLFQAI